MIGDTVLPPALGTDTAPGAAELAQRLDEAPQGVPFRVRHVEPDPALPERARQLEEIGFFPGERVMLMARGVPGGDPLVIRIGLSTFALRRAEAACVRIEPVPRAG